jgi:sirohydrochlorin cobaltochelatase
MKKISKTLSIVLVLAMFIGLLAGCSEVDSKGAVNEDTEKMALLVVSFGTSFDETRDATIGATEEALSAAYPDYDLVRAFGSQTIIDILAEREDGEDVYNVEEAITAIYEEGYGKVLVQPTFVINGEEYEEMMAVLEEWAPQFAEMYIGDPILTSVDDYYAVLDSLAADTDMATINDTEGEAFVLMGHGTPASGNSAYGQFAYMLTEEGYDQVFIGTVEGYPTFDDVLASLQADPTITKVTLMPFMIVAGDHANNDMAGDEEDSWKVMLKAEGYEVDTILTGLGELDSIHEILIEHAQLALDGESLSDAKIAEEEE